MGRRGSHVVLFGCEMLLRELSGLDGRYKLWCRWGGWYSGLGNKLHGFLHEMNPVNVLNKGVTLADRE